METTKTIDFTVTKENLKEDILAIYSKLFDDAKKEDLHFEELKGGNINIICLVTNSKDKDKSIIFRNFNMKQRQEELEKAFKEIRTDDQTGASKKDDSIFKLLFDREGEVKLMNELSKHKLTQLGEIIVWTIKSALLIKSALSLSLYSAG